MNLSRWILKLAGWKSVYQVEEPAKSVICVAPHTSNWDFIIGKLYYWSLNKKAGFLMKKSWFFFPMGYLFRAMGGVPIDRSKRTSVTQQRLRNLTGGRFFTLPSHLKEPANLILIGKKDFITSRKVRVYLFSLLIWILEKGKWVLPKSFIQRTMKRLILSIFLIITKV